MAERGYKRGPVSRVKNTHSRERYLISTAREVGKDYWTTSLFPYVFFGLIPAITKPIFTIVRNDEEGALYVHSKVKDIATNFPESEWITWIPDPDPIEGFSEDAKKILRKKLGDKF